MVVGCYDEVFVFDCGAHNQYHGARRSWRRLVERTASEEIETIAVSHLHFDHYSGLLLPLPNVRPDATFVIGRMPLLEDDPDLGNEFLLRLLAYAPLDAREGPLDLGLLQRISQWAPDLVPKPVSQGDHFYAAGERWRVLWPPRKLKPSARVSQSIRDAIDAYDLAADAHGWPKMRLEQMRESETYKILLREMNESKDHRASQLDEELVDDSDSPERDESDDSDSPECDQTDDSDSLDAADKDLLAEAGRCLRKAANHMSLIVASDSRVLLTGDASRSAMTQALGKNPGAYSVVLTPHHGGKNYLPNAVKQKTLSSQVWVSSAGGRLSPHVCDQYDNLPGIHFRTDRHYDVDLLVRKDSVHLVNAGFGRRLVDWPFDPLYMR